MSLTQRLIAQAEHWEGKRYGDQGLRLKAEATSALLREAANEFQQLRERIEQLPTIQHGSPSPTHFEATPLIRRDDVLKILNSQQEK